MPRVGRPRTVAQGIYAHTTRYRVTAAIGRTQQEESFPLGTALEKMQAWQLRTKAKLLGAKPTVGPDTLAADVPRFLATVADTKTAAYQQYNLAPWIEKFGHLPRTAISSLMIRGALAAWQREASPRGKPWAANTLNHRLAALRSLYNVLDADDDEAVNPCVKVPKISTPKPEPREIPGAVLDAIFAALPVHRYAGVDEPTARAIYTAATVPKANRTAIARQYGISETAVRKIVDRKGVSQRATLATSRVRLEVKRTTGLPWTQIAAVKPEHLQVTPGRGAVAGRLWVTPRRKGKGTEGRWLPLTAEGCAAVQALVTTAPGKFSPSSVYKTFRRALRKALAAAQESGQPLPPFPDKLRPYDIRHTFLTRVQRAGRDRKATQGLAVHANSSTIDRYVIGAELDGEEAALEALSAGARRGQDTGS